MKRTIAKHKGKQIFYGIFLLILIPFSFLFDNVIQKNFLKFHNPFFDMIFVLFSDPLIILLFIFLIIIVMMKIKRDHKWIIAMFTSILLTFIIVYYLKFLIARPRPSGIILISYFNMIDYSFPSFHTALLFSIIPILDKGFSHHKKLWIFIGVMIALSRLYLGVHYFSDVIFGGFIGLLVGEIILLIEKRYGWFKLAAKKIWS